MRKRNFSFALDNLLWWFVYLLPVFGWLISLIAARDIVPFNAFLSENLSFVITSDNVIVTTLSSIFGADGVLPLIANSDSSILIFAAYFLTTYLIHLCIDVLMLLPRMVMHAMDKLGGQE